MPFLLDPADIARPTRRTLIGGGIASLALLVAGCNSSSQQAAPSAAATPQLVTDDRGRQVGLATKPTRVSAIYDGLDVDNLVALGLTPISTGINAAKPDRPRPWLDGKLVGAEYLATTDGIQFEMLATLQPELIVSAYYDEKAYDKLEAIAPLFMLPTSQSWREQVAGLGALLWRESEAAAAIQAVDDAVAASKATVTSRVGEQLAVICTFQGDTSQVYQSTRLDGIGWALNALGFADLVEPKEADAVFNLISVENLDQIKGDRLVVIDFDYEEADPSPTTTKLLASELGAKIPAAEGGVIWMSKAATNASYLDTALSQQFLVAELAEKLA